MAAALFDLKNFIPAPAPAVHQERGEREREGMGGGDEEVEQAVVAKAEPDDHSSLAPEAGKGRGNSREGAAGGKTLEGMRSPSFDPEEGCMQKNDRNGSEGWRQSCGKEGRGVSLGCSSGVRYNLNSITTDSEPRN